MGSISCKQNKLLTYEELDELNKQKQKKIIDKVIQNFNRALVEHQTKNPTLSSWELFVNTKGLSLEGNVAIRKIGLLINIDLEPNGYRITKISPFGVVNEVYYCHLIFSIEKIDPPFLEASG